MRACRDGMFLFDFADWGEPPAETVSAPDDFEAEAAYQVRCVRLMNAHSACLATASNWIQSPTVVTPGRLLRMNFETGDFIGAGGPGSDFEIWKSRMGEFHRADERIMRGTIVTTAELREAADGLIKLMNLSDQHVALLRAELILRSGASYADYDSNAALVFAWIVAESVLGELLNQYLNEVGDRPVEEGKFMPRDRRDFILGSEMTARHTAELLSLADRLPFGLYKAVRASAKARNDWLHYQNEITEAQAARALTAAQELFTLVRGPNLRMPLGRHLH